MRTCVLKPSLEHLALVKITIGLLSEDLIEDLVTSKIYEDNGIIKDRIAKLPIPVHLKKNVSDFVRPIVIEVELWNEYHETDRRLKDNFSKLRWMSNGTIDRKITAILLAEDEDLDVIVRYKIARMYCLEDYVVELWMMIPDDVKESDPTIHIDESSDDDIDWRVEPFKTSFIIRHFLFDADGIKNNTPQTVPLSFQYAAVSGNKVVTEYFLNKITEEEKINSITNTILFVCHNLSNYDILFDHHPLLNARYCVDVLMFLLTQVDEEIQRSTINSIKRKFYASFDILKFFLDWPWQNVFLEAADYMWAIIEDYKCSYFNLLMHIVDKIRSGFRDYDYYKLLRAIWIQSPLTLKTFVIENDCFRLLNYLSTIEDGEEYIKMILKYE